MKIADNSVVALHYKLTGNNEQLLDSSENQEPLIYMHNTGAMLPDLENALAGRSAGDVLKVDISAADGYGVRYPELLQALPLAAFEGQTPSPGMFFEARGKDGEAQRLVIKQVTQNQVTVDANHPLAGENLCFNVAILSVREPTAEELELGHAHTA